MSMKLRIGDAVLQAFVAAQKDSVLPDFSISEIVVDYPAQKEFGDYATNACMRYAKQVKKSPEELSSILIEYLNKQKGIQEMVETITFANPGFLNFSLKNSFVQEQIISITREGDNFGNSKQGDGKSINLEFISANPTGPLTLPNGRGGYLGDSLARVLKKTGHKVVTEYYLNDRGVQISILGKAIKKVLDPSLDFGEETVYSGEYIEEIAKRLEKDGKINEDNYEEIGKKGLEILLSEQIKPVIEKMGITFDNWFSEQSLYDSGEVSKVMEVLQKKDLTYTQDNALYFKTTQFSDDKDRVLIKGDGHETYFLSDIAYHKNKMDRGATKMINIWGADHHGYIQRLQSAMNAMGYENSLDIIVMQLVKLIRDGKEFRMSKRQGNFVTLEWLLDEVGEDVARFFFIMYDSTTPFNFDLDLAKKQTDENPVFYVQYAHARICSILKKAENISDGDISLLNDESELNLIKELMKFPDLVADVADTYKVHLLAHYAIDIAKALHHFYQSCHVLTEDKKVQDARLELILATKGVIKNTLDLIGVSTPESM